MNILCNPIFLSLLVSSFIYVYFKNSNCVATLNLDKYTHIYISVFTCILSYVALTSVFSHYNLGNNVVSAPSSDEVSTIFGEKFSIAPFNS